MSILRAICSFLLLLITFPFWFISACLADVLMKCFYAIGLEREARYCLYFISKLIEYLFYLWGTRVEFEATALTNDSKQPIVFVASHHSSLDIVLLTNYLFRRIGPRQLGYISRNGLNKGIPAVSVYLRQHGCCLDKKKQNLNKNGQQQSTDNIHLPQFAQRVNQQGNALVIFPEGVNAAGCPEHCRPFRRKGLRMMLNNIPNAQIIPIAIAGTGSFYTTARNWRDLFRCMPDFKQNISIQMLPPISTVNLDIEKTIDLLEQQITTGYQRLLERPLHNNNGIREHQKWTP